MAASACAGLLLGLAELIVAAPSVRLPPPLGLALVWSCAILVVACGSALLLLMRLGRMRSTRSDLVGGMLGPLSIVALVSPAWARCDSVWTELAVTLGAGLGLVLTGAAGALVARRLEGERPALPGLSWSGAAVLLAGLACSLHGGATGSSWRVYASIPAGAAVGATGLLGIDLSRSRAPRTHFGGLLLALTLAALVAPFWPSWLPWLLADRNLPEVGAWPPNFLFVALQAPAAPERASSESTTALLELLRVDAVTYENLCLDPRAEALLALPDGSLLGTELRAAGYATAAIGIIPQDLRALGFAEVDARLGGRRVVEESAAWMAGASLLLGPASGLFGLLGHASPFRSPKQVGEEAARWMLSWRTTRARTPFFLFVDLRTPNGDAEELDAGLQPVVDRLAGLRIDAVTVLVVAFETRGSASSADCLRALVLPPSTWLRTKRVEATTQIQASALSQSLLQIALSDGESPVRLAGLDQDLSPPKIR